MEEILLWGLAVGLLLITFLIILIVSMVRKSKRLTFISLAILIFAVCSAGWTAYLLTSKSYRKVSDMLKPRTGVEIYTALFGMSDNQCVEVLNHQDQVVPKIDYAIWLHFKTCRDELQRVLSLHDFDVEKKSTNNLQSYGLADNDNWFKPEALGDTIFVFRYKKDQFGKGQTIYSSLDSTEAFCIDVAD